MESSKATAKQIKQVASDLQTAKINLMHHQCTELPPNTFKRKQKPFKSRQDNHKKYSNEEEQRVPQADKKYDNYQAHASHERCTKCGDSQHIEGFRCSTSKHQCRNCHKYDHFSSLCYKKREVFDKKRSLESKSPTAHQLQISSVYMQDSICGQSENLSSSKVHSAWVKSEVYTSWDQDTSTTISYYCNRVDMPIILIYIFNKYFEPYLLLAFNINVSLGIWRSQSFIPLKFLVKLCPYSIKFQIHFIHIWPGCPQWTGHGPSLFNEVHLVSSRHPGGSCANPPLEADQSKAPSVPCFGPLPFIAHKRKVSRWHHYWCAPGYFLL